MFNPFRPVVSGTVQSYQRLIISILRYCLFFKIWTATLVYLNQNRPMKVFTILFFFLALSSKAFTQISSGQFLLGGNIRFESVKENYYRDATYKSTNFFIAPAIGYFILDKLAGGVRVDFSSYKSNSTGVDTRQSSTAISPFVRYYFLPAASKVNAFLDAGYLHSNSKWKRLTDPAFSVTDQSKGFQVLAGPSLFLSNQIALEFILGYLYTKSDGSPGQMEATKSTSFSSGLGLQVHFGKKRQPRAS